MPLAILHAADLHLDSPLAGLEAFADAPVAEIRTACRRALDNLVDLALAEEVKLVLIAGDLVDGDWQDYNTALFLADRLGRLTRAGIRVCLVTGNHDGASPLGRRLVLPEGVHLFDHQRPETRVFDDIRVAVHGQSFGAREERANLAREFPEPVAGLCNIGLVHTSLAGRPGHAPYAPCTREDLVGRHYHYWALGHVHKREVVSREPWIVYPGNLQGRHVRETGAKGATLVRLDDDRRIVGVEHHELDVVRFFAVEEDCSGADSLAKLHRRLAERLAATVAAADGRTACLRLTLTGATPLHDQLHRLRDQVNEEVRAAAAATGGCWLERLLLATRPARPPATDPGSPLAALLAELQGESQTLDLEELAPVSAELLRRLPPEVRGEATAVMDDPAALLRQVGDLLAARFLPEDDPPAP